MLRTKTTMTTEDSSPPDDAAYEVGISKKTLLGYLRGLPDDTEICLESFHEIDGLAGAIYYPKQGILSLVGNQTEVEIDVDDVATAVVLGDVRVANLEDLADALALDGVFEEVSPEVANAIRNAMPDSGTEGPPFDPDPIPESGEPDAPPRPAAS